MGYTSSDRDRGRVAVTAATGLGVVGALTVTGWLTGRAAADFADQQTPTTGAADDRTGPQSAARASGRPDRDRSAPRQRPYVTRVTLRYVQAAGTIAVAPSTGAPVTAPAPAPSSSGSGSSGSGSSGSSGPGSSAPAPAPAPAPEPAPSSGS